MLKKILLFTGVTFSVAVFAAGATGNKKNTQDKPTAHKSEKQPEEKIPDYSKGFELFHKMGLPNVSKAEYGNLHLYLTMPPGSGNLYFSGGQLSGNSWLLKTNPDDSMECLYNQAVELKVISRTAAQKMYQKKMKEVTEKYKSLKDQQKLQKIMQQELASLHNMITSNFTKADIKKDYEIFLKAADKEDFSYEKSKAYYGLLFAVHLHDKGMKQEANKLAHVMFKKAGGRKKVIAGAVSILADCMYTSVTYKFQQNKNWKEYAKAVSALNKRFSMVWANKASVSKILEMLNNKVAGKVEPITGKDITEADKKLVMELAQKATPGSVLSVMNENTIFPSPDKQDAPKDNILAQIKSKGVKSIPLLCAMLNNTTMIDVMCYHLNSRHYYGGNQQIGWKQFNLRPATLGDLAKMILMQLIPLSEEREPLSEKLLVAQAMKFYQENKDKNQEQLAELYLKKGNDAQKTQAIEYLMAKKSPKYDKIIEDYLLSHVNNVNQNMIADFVRRRGEKAKEFAKKYVQKCRDMLKGQDFGNDRYKKEMEKRYDKLEEMLMGLCSGMTAETYLGEIAVGKRKMDKSSGELLRTLFDGKEFGDQVKCILEAVLKAKTPELKEKLLNLIYYSRRFKIEDKLTNKELWKKVLADKTILKPDKPYLTVRFYAANIFQTVFLKTDKGNLEINKNILSDERAEIFILKRINAFMEGKEVPAWSSGKIKPEKLNQLRESLMKTPEAGLKKAIAGLSDNDLIAVAQSLKPDGKLNRKMLKVANVIDQCSVIPKKLKLNSKVPEFKGTLTPDTLEELWLFFIKEQKAGNNIVCTLTRKECLGGVCIYITAAEKPEKENKSEVLRSQVNCGDMNDIISIKMTVGKSEKKPETVTDKLSEDEKLLMEAVAEMYRSDAAKSKNAEKKLKKKFAEFCNATSALNRGTISFQRN